MYKNMDFILNVSALHSRMIKNLDRKLSLHGIAFTEFLVMYQLSLVSNKTARRIDLAQSVGMSASGITRLLNPLEKLNLVEKEQDPRDARVSYVKLSTTGSKLLNDAIISVMEVNDSFLEPLESDSIELFLDFTKKII